MQLWWRRLLPGIHQQCLLHCLPLHGRRHCAWIYWLWHNHNNNNHNWIWLSQLCLGWRWLLRWRQQQWNLHLWRRRLLPGKCSDRLLHRLLMHWCHQHHFLILNIYHAREIINFERSIINSNCLPSRYNGKLFSICVWVNHNNNNHNWIWLSLLWFGWRWLLWWPQ